MKKSIILFVLLSVLGCSLASSSCPAYVCPSTNIAAPKTGVGCLIPDGTN